MGDELVMRLDLDGQIFDIYQCIIDKYPESVFAKSMMVSDGQETEPIEIDRDGKYFSKILEYGYGNRRAFNLSRMSRIDIKKLVNDLNFFGVADDLVKKCEHELTVKNQRCIETAITETEFKDIIAGETRIIIVLSLELLISTSKDDPGERLEKALKLVDRDKCFITGYTGKLKGFTSKISGITEDCLVTNDDAVLCDPVTHEILQTYGVGHVSGADLLQMVYYANTLHSYALLERTYTKDLVKEEGQEKNVGNLFLDVKRLD